MRSLLYGANVDRAVKAKARLGLIIVVFTLVYSVIAGRLVWFASMSEAHVTKHSVAREAVSTARPDIFDRNGLIIATDVKTPSLFAEPRKLIDVDEATELLTAEIPELDTAEVRDRLASKRGFAWIKREISPEQQKAVYRLGIPGVGFLTENRRVYPNGPVVSHVLGHVNIDNQGIAGIEKWLDGQGLAALHMAGLATDRLQNPVELSIDLRVQYVLREELAAAKEKYQSHRRIRRDCRRQHRRDPRDGVGARLRSEQPREALDPARINRSPSASMRWARPSRRSPSRWRSTSGKITWTRLRCALPAALRHSPSAISTANSAS